MEAVRAEPVEVRTASIRQLFAVPFTLRQALRELVQLLGANVGRLVKKTENKLLGFRIRYYRLEPEVRELLAGDCCKALGCACRGDGMGRGPGLVAALLFQRLSRADIAEIVIGEFGDESGLKRALLL